MRNLRKLMAVIVSVAMMVSLFVVPAFAEQTMTDVEVCELLGVLKGTGSGLTAEYLASKPQRYQAARLFLRLQGLEDDALAFEGTANFSDVEEMPDWQLATENKAVLAYLYANPELGFVGYTDGTFRPFNEISAMEYYKVLLTALGYEQNVDYVYGDDLLDFAASLGLSEVADVEDFTIMHLATATVEGLKAAVKDEEVTLIEKLVADGVIDEELAAETGIYEEEVAALEVEEITADNLAEVYVKFNQEMNKDTIKKDNFKVAGAKVGAAALQNDGVTVKLTVASDKIGKDGVNYKVEITTDVKSAAGAAFEKAYTGYVRVFDNELPYVTGVALTGPKTIQFTFNEPIKKAGEVKITRGSSRYGCKVEAISGVTNKVTVTINASKLAEAEYTLEIKGFEDYAGHVMDADEQVLAYAEDKSPITAEVTSATQSQVKVKFNKRVTLSDALTSYFYHTFSSYMPIKVETSDNMTYTLTFVDDDANTTDYPIKEGTNQLVVKYKGANGTKIKDEWGNTLESNIVISIEVSADDTAPTVVGEVNVASQTEIEITFSEDVKNATDPDNYLVEDEDGEEVEIDDASYSTANDKYVVTLEFADDLVGAYTITISGIVDNSLNENEIEETVLSFEVEDMTRPVLSDTTATAVERDDEDDDDVIYVRFPEKVLTEGKYSVLDPANYLFNGEALHKDTKIEPFGSSGQEFMITIPNADDQDVIGADLTVSRVEDLAGNVSVLLSYTIEDIEEEAAPKVEKVEQTAANKISVTIDKILISVLEDLLLFEFDGEEYGVAGIEDVSYDESKGNTIVKFLLDGEFVDALEDETEEDAREYGLDTGLLVTNIPGVVVKVFGEFMESDKGMVGAEEDVATVIWNGDSTIEAGEIAFTDKWVASYDSIAVNVTVADDVYTSVATITFTEALKDELEVFCANDLVIKDASGKDLVAGVGYTTTIEGGKLVVTFVGNVDVLAGEDDEKYYSIASKDSITYLKDAGNNKVAKFSKKDIKN